MMRPTAVTVISVLGIVFSALGLCCTLLGSASLAFLMGMGDTLAAQPGASNKDLQVFQNPIYQRYMLATIAVTFLLSIWLLISSVMLLRMSPTGLSLMLAWAAVAILWLALDTILTFTVLHNVVGSRQLTSQLVGAVIWLIYPLAVFVVLTRPNIKAAFQQQRF